MEFATRKLGSIDEMASPVLATGEAGFWTKAEHQLVAGDSYFLDGVEISIEGADEIAGRLSCIGTFDFEPPGSAVRLLRHCDIPVAIEAGSRLRVAKQPPS